MSHKYGAKPVVVDGERFDSQGEHRRWLELKILERAGDVRCLRRQTKHMLSAPHFETGEPVLVRFASKRVAYYVADFEYEERKGDGWVWVIEDFKGVDTPLSKLKRAIVEAMYGTRVRVTRKHTGRRYTAAPASRGFGQPAPAF